MVVPVWFCRRHMMGSRRVQQVVRGELGFLCGGDGLKALEKCAGQGRRIEWILCGLGKAEHSTHRRWSVCRRLTFLA